MQQLQPGNTRYAHCLAGMCNKEVQHTGSGPSMCSGKVPLVGGVWQLDSQPVGEVFQLDLQPCTTAMYVEQQHCQVGDSFSPAVAGMQ